MANFPPNRMSLSNPSDALLKAPEMEPMLDEKHASSIDRSDDGLFSHRYRYLVLILGCLCLTSICSNMITFNFTLICMQKESPITGMVEGVPGNITSSKKLITFVPMFDQQEKSWLMWAVAGGSIVATFPFNVAYAYYGARTVFFAAGMMSAIATLLVPLCIKFGLGYFIVARIVQVCFYFYIVQNKFILILI
uniref:Major facilitator superfamily (MFS) profile domain-containing protein n=1 Tax=Panagrolaimus superbus TaxID=310955 RepID=A0A914YNA5_9BILA